jgi:colanic acid/amylovoran biosynthesis glycosyltransferase
MSTPERVVAIFQSELVRASEAFIVEQPRAMERYASRLIGLRRCSTGTSIDVPRDAVVINETGAIGRMAATAFALGHCGRTIVGRLLELRPIVLHAHFGTEGARCLDLARRAGVPLVTTYHGFDVQRPVEELRRGTVGDRLLVRRRPRLAAEGTLHIAVSDFIRAGLIDLGFPRDRIVRHYIGVDTELFRPPETSSAERVLLFVGRLSKEKGCIDAANAAAVASREFPDVRFVVIGDGAERESITDLAASVGLRCDMLGIRSRTDVSAWMQRATLVLGPSQVHRGQREALGLAYVEAQACGTPVVGYRSGGVAEAVVHGVTGLLAKEGDQTELADYVLTLLRDDGLRSRMGDAGRARVLQEFDIRVQSRQLELLYDKVLAERSSLD